MSNYAIFFDHDNITFRLPTNPEQIEITSNQAIEKYEVLKLGQVAIPTHMELKAYSFECELPIKAYNYVENKNGFLDADAYINLFEKWRNNLVPVYFKASNGVSKDIDTYVLIEELSITEKAGEEGDKYVSFKLLEYKEFKKLYPIKIDANTGSTINTPSTSTVTNPNIDGYYVVKSGDCLWSIAKKYYGDGSKYTKIYNANSNIKNPALIYPGQKLVIPI